MPYQSFIIWGHVDTVPFMLVIFVNSSASSIGVKNVFNVSETSAKYENGVKISHIGTTIRYMIFSSANFSVNY